MIEPTPQQWEEIDELILKKCTIQAIKAYQAITGETSLKTAMDLIGDRQKNLRVTPRQWEDIDHLLFKDRTIQAIKAYRDITGATIKEAMELIVTRQEALLANHPERFQSESDTTPSSDEGRDRA